MAETEEEPINLLQDFHQSSKQKRALRRRSDLRIVELLQVQKAQDTLDNEEVVGMMVPYMKVDVLLKLTVELLEISSSMKVHKRLLKGTLVCLWRFCKIREIDFGTRYLQEGSRESLCRILGQSVTCYPLSKYCDEEAVAHPTRLYEVTIYPGEQE
ncbi:hypothetical protein KY284_003148 [Solanum tuberosum]|nr:hypothetical protein KY284_003148 [Solanum tuberosum]